VEEEAQLLLPTEAPRPQAGRVPVATVGGADVHSRLSMCCQPLPGDEIIGYVTRGKGLTVHRADCKNALYHIGREPHRAVDVSWATQGAEKLTAQVEITALDRVGLLSHLTAIIAEDGINIASAAVTTGKRPGLATLRLGLQVENRARLDQLISRLDGLQDVLQVRKL
jgi:GTP pyrophosphokinase